MILVAVYDKKSSTYAGPICFEHMSHALRSYVQFARQKPDASQVQFSEDYDLYDVGSFDAISGVVTPCLPASYLESFTHIVAQARKEAPRG